MVQQVPTTARGTCAQIQTCRELHRGSGEENLWEKRPAMAEQLEPSEL